MFFLPEACRWPTRRCWPGRWLCEVSSGSKVHWGNAGTWFSASGDACATLDAALTVCSTIQCHMKSKKTWIAIGFQWISIAFQWTSINFQWTSIDFQWVLMIFDDIDMLLWSNRRSAQPPGPAQCRLTSKRMSRHVPLVLTTTQYSA